MVGILFSASLISMVEYSKRIMELLLLQYYLLSSIEKYSLKDQNK